MKLRNPTILATLLALSPGAAPPAFPEARFDPHVELSYGFNDNLFNTALDEDKIEDNLLIVTADLEGKSTWKKGTFSYRYQPALFRYQDKDGLGTDVLDRDEHRVRLRLRTQPSRTVNLDFRLDGRLTQVQGDATENGAPDQFLGPRNDRKLYGGNFDLDSQISRLWKWRVGLEGRFERFDPIAEVVAVAEDRDSFRGRLAFTRDISTLSTLGLEYVRSDFELEFSGDSQADAVLVTYTKQLSEKLRLELSGGGFSTRGVNGNETSDDDGFQGHVDLTGQYQKVLLKVTFRQEPTSGGGLLGTSTNTVLGLNLNSVGRGPWGWFLAPRYAHRKPTNSNQDTQDSLAFRVELTRRITQKFRVRLRSNYINQSRDDPAQQDRSVFFTDFGVIWSPAAGTRLAGR